MGQTLSQKKDRSTLYATDLEKAKILVLAEYRGLTVAQLKELRQELFKQDAKFTVVKNTLIKRVMKDTNHAALMEAMKGPNALLIAFGDEIAPTKTLKSFLTKAKIGEIKAGLMQGQALNKAQVLELADMPSFDELRGKLVGVLHAPLAGLVGAVSSQQRGLVNVLDQYAKILEAKG